MPDKEKQNFAEESSAKEESAAKEYGYYLSLKNKPSGHTVTDRAEDQSALNEDWLIHQSPALHGLDLPAADRI